MTNREDRTPGKLFAWGQLIAAVPEFQELRDSTADLMDQGTSEEDVREHVLQEGRDLRIIGPRTMLPSLTRKVTRLPLRKFLHLLADSLADKAQGKRVGDVVDGLWEKIGAEEWFADYIIDWAKTGEPGQFFELFGGRVWSQRMHPDKDAPSAVWMVVTPTSDPRALLEEAYRECVKTLPPESFSQYGANIRAHKIARLHLDGLNWDAIAEILLDEDDPQWRTYETADQRVYLREAKKNAKRLFERWKEYWGSFSEKLGPESD